MKSSLLTLLGVTFILAASPLLTFAGPVTATGGRGEVFFDGGGFQELYATPFPGAGEVVIEADDPSDPGGAPDGTGTVRYALGQSGAGAVFGLGLENIAAGDWASRGGTFFSIDFETDRPLRYRLDAAAPEGGDSWAFFARLDEVVSATASVEEQEDFLPTVVQGNMPHEGTTFGPLVQEGFLPTGSHFYFVGVRARRDDFVRGQVTLVLEAPDAPGPNPIPLPAAFPAGLVGMFSAAAVGAVRRARGGMRPGGRSGEKRDGRDAVYLQGEGGRP